MRIAVLVLLLANLGFFSWSYLQGSQPAEVPPPPAVASLQLAASRAAPATRCQSLGPFTDSTRMLSVSAALTARGIGSLVRQVERPVTDGNWVYIDDLKGAADRQRVLQSLKRAGLRDVAEMTEPQYAGRISAGIFMDPRGADERAASVRAAGFTPKIEVRQHVVPERWLNVEWPIGAAPIAPAELGVAEGGDVHLSWAECPSLSGGSGSGNG